MTVMQQLMQKYRNPATFAPSATNKRLTTVYFDKDRAAEMAIRISWRISHRRTCKLSWRRSSIEAAPGSWSGPLQWPRRRRAGSCRSCRFRHDISPLEEGCLSGIFQRQDIPGCRRTMRQCDDRMHINDECELKRKHPLPCEWETGVEE